MMIILKKNRCDNKPQNTLTTYFECTCPLSFISPKVTAMIEKPSTKKY